jgi:hypothetical protein
MVFYSSLIKKVISLSILLISTIAFNYLNISYAQANSIPYSSDFPEAQYPYAKAPNGCGPGLFTNDRREIRDTWGPVNFTGACNTHDKCYYTLSSNWNTCNERFYSDLRAACERDLRTSVSVPAPTLRDPLRTRRVDLPPDPVRLTSCYAIATSYYGGVQGGVALDVFKDAQNLQRRYEQWVSNLPHCVSVDSRQGWRRFNLPRNFTKIASISGGWSVDTARYTSVGASGHTGRDAELLTPYNNSKFDQRFPFGALLMGSGQGTLWIQSPSSFSSAPFGAVDMRINDADNSLGDNAGALQVCFSN